MVRPPGGIEPSPHEPIVNYQHDAEALKHDFFGSGFYFPKARQQLHPEE
jgi:hypothetical protein